MKNYIIIPIFAILIIILNAFGCSRESQGTACSKDNTREKMELLSDIALIEQYNLLIKQLSLVTKIDGCTYSNLKPTISEMKYDASLDTFIRTIRGPIKMDLDAYTGEAYFIYNDVIAEKIFDPKQFEPANKLHTKTEDEVKAIGEDILKKIPRRETSGVQLELIKFDLDKRKGEWFVQWHRTHNGYQYIDDWVQILYHEKYGLASYSSGFTSTSCPTEVKIQEEEAKKKALSIAAEAIRSDLPMPSMGQSYKQWFNNFKLGEISRSELFIINPNYLFTEKSSTDISKRIRNARLAWVICINAPLINKVGPKGEILAGTVISIWIDAATGEMLGGMFSM
jgi:hypothetical protein